ncbi:hypothetical protein [Sorangium sp. So ce1335]|uniref:hypothetical protein n=1 Tax=Sorangium sp. So ce1335 TaxID=3133335 RepID=UPI003F63D3E8
MHHEHVAVAVDRETSPRARWRRGVWHILTPEDALTSGAHLRHVIANTIPASSRLEDEHIADAIDGDLHYTRKIETHPQAIAPDVVALGIELDQEE